MLLLSSATRILATHVLRELHRSPKHRWPGFCSILRYWSILHRGRQRISGFPVSQVNTLVTCTNGRVARFDCSQKKGVARGPAFSTSDPWRPSSYQGTNLRTPFFFLLVDSLILSPLFPEGVGATSVLDASVLDAVPEAVVPLASVPVATVASDVDSPGIAELDSGGGAVVGAPFSGVVPAGAEASAG